MATRCYYDAAATPAVSPAFDTSWEWTTDAARRKLNITKGASSQTTFTINSDSVTTNHQGNLALQFVSNPLAAGTLSGTVKGQMLTRESSNAANAAAEIVIKVVSGDGSTVRGIAYGPTGDVNTGNPVSEFGTTLSNRMMPRGGSTALSSVTITAGDRLVVEVGATLHNIQSTVYTLDFGIGESDGDLTEDETAGAGGSWIEFSATLAEATAAPPPIRRSPLRLRR